MLSTLRFRDLEFLVAPFTQQPGMEKTMDQEPRVGVLLGICDKRIVSPRN